MKIIGLLTLLTSVLGLNYVQLINKERAKYGLEKITYDLALEQRIKNYSIDPYWYYNTSQDYKTYNHINGKYRRLNGDHLMNYMNETNYEFLMRDRTNRSIKYIVWFRLNQRKCFNWNKCSKTEYTDYLSCKRMGTFKPVPYTRCSWAYAYMPKLMEKDLKSIACVLLGKPPDNNKEGFHLENKKRSFFCYSNKVNKTNDNPFD